MLRWITGLISVLLLAIMAGCGGSDDDPKNLVQVAQGDSRFSILVEAVQAAGLTDTLAAPGPATVFAPTNEAFAALLGELGVTKEQLLANKPLLTSVLQYHVVAGRIPGSAVPLDKAINPVGGGFFKIDKVGASLVITDGRNRKSNIVQADIAAANGVIHAIDKVLLPADKNIVQTAIATADFSILVEAVTAAGLGETLSAPGPYTVFAPTNAAFASLLTELGLSKEELLANKPLLIRVLTYHVVPGLVLRGGVPVNTPIKTVEGGTFTVNQALAIVDQRGRQSNIVATDVLASNGVIHVLDKVILPTP